MISSIKNRFARRLDRQHLILGALCVFIAIQLPYKLARLPRFWFDEGNVASVARNWVEIGHYGLILLGSPAPRSGAITVGFPAVAPIALSFRLLGVGIRQARVPGVFFTVGAVGALWLLARQLYDRSVATVTVAAALLLPVLPDMHPILAGRQALGEIPALFYLLIGLLCLQRAWEKPGRSLPLAVLFWALSLQTKPQVLPFLAAALVLPMGLLLWRRCFREARILGLGLLGALVTSVALARVWCLVLGGAISSRNPASNTFAATAASWERLIFNAFQLDPGVRGVAVFTAVLTGTPVLLGLCYAGRQFLTDPDLLSAAEERTLGRLVVWTLASSWFTWYILLSIAWPRYLFPAAFLGNVFSAALIEHLTDGFTTAPWQRWAAVRREQGFSASRVGILTGLISLPVALMLTVLLTYASFALMDGSAALIETAEFLNSRTERDALIEMDDRELFFLVERVYHYPIGEIRHQLKRRVFLREDVTLDYDPLVADPDYLVVGPMSRMLELYDPVLETDAFRLVHSNELYQVYERVRYGGASRESGSMHRLISAAPSPP